MGRFEGLRERVVEVLQSSVSGAGKTWPAGTLLTDLPPILQDELRGIPGVVGRIGATVVSEIVEEVSERKIAAEAADLVSLNARTLVRRVEDSENPELLFAIGQAEAAPDGKNRTSVLDAVANRLRVVWGRFEPPPEPIPPATPSPTAEPSTETVAPEPQPDEGGGV